MLAKNQICFDFYQKGHTSLNCVLHLQKRRQIISNYEALSPKGRLAVPPASYREVVQIFGLDDRNNSEAVRSYTPT